MFPRRAARPLLPAVLLSLLLVPAAPAAAAGGITSPGSGAVVSRDTVVPLRAVVDGPAVRPSELTLTEPGTGEERVVAVSASPDGGELAADFDTACAQPGCTGRAPARNGTWTLRLRGAADDERTFELRIPPAVPADVVAEPSGEGVLLGWSRGAEPDLTGYAVEDTAGAPVRMVGLEACDAAGRCRVEVPADSAGWAVRAHRRTCPDCVTTLVSQPSEPVRVEPTPGQPPVQGLVERPGEEPEQPAAAPPLTDQRAAFARAFGTGRVAPPQGPAAPPSAAVAPAVEPDGTYDLALEYSAPSTQDTSGSSLEESLGALSSTSRLRLLLISGLLIGTAMWLRRWSRRVIAD